MGGAFGGMMMRIANSMGMGGYPTHSAYRSPKEPESWASSQDRETKQALKRIQNKQQAARDKAVAKFERELLKNQQTLYEAGLLKEGDTLYRILCRAAGVPYRKKKRKK